MFAKGQDIMSEQQEELRELKKFQRFFQKNINSESWEYVAEKLPNAYISIISQIMRAKTPDDINWLVLRTAYYVKDRIEEIKKSRPY